MFGRHSRRVTAATLVAVCLCLTLAPAASAATSTHVRPSAVAGTGLFSSLWSLLVSLWAGDDGNPNPGPPGPNHDEGPGMCPHGGH